MKEKFRFRNLIVLVLCVIFLFGFIKQQSAMNRIKKETKERAQMLEQLKKKNEKLTDEVNISETEEYHEKLAREKLNMIKEGEKSVEKQSLMNDSTNSSAEEGEGE